MSAAVKISPVQDFDSFCMEITFTPKQLRHEAKDFVEQLHSAGISPLGLHFEDFVPVVLRRRMADLAIEAKRLGILCVCSPWMVLGKEDDWECEDPCIRFLFPDEENAILFRTLLL